ncbi:MAG: helix-turn-helix domain-containing protein [Clostridium chrysemydis]|uniref:helix-turn-helix domain-containing protein n=1 Tax=Clostridium chrysemydis TaxID=2665504 RepID=UPI003F40F20C
MSCEINLDNIRRYRKLKGLSQLELASMVGISEPTLSKIELGTTSPRIETLEKIGDILGICPFDLMECNCKSKGVKCTDCCKKCERHKCNNK